MTEKKIITKIKKKIRETIADTLNPTDPIFLKLSLPKRLVLEKSEIDGYLQGMYDCKQITQKEQYELGERFKNQIIKEMIKYRDGKND